MQDIFDLIDAVKAGQFWAAIKLAIKILYDYKDVLPVDGQPQPMKAASSADDIPGLLAELEFHSAQPVGHGMQAAAIPWKTILDILLKLLPLLFQKA